MYHPAGVCLMLIGNMSDEQLKRLTRELDAVVPEHKLPRHRPRIAWTSASPLLKSNERRCVVDGYTLNTFASPLANDVYFPNILHDLVSC